MTNKIVPFGLVNSDGMGFVTLLMVPECVAKATGMIPMPLPDLALKLSIILFVGLCAYPWYRKGPAQPDHLVRRHCNGLFPSPHCRIPPRGSLFPFRREAIDKLKLHRL